VGQTRISNAPTRAAKATLPRRNVPCPCGSAKKFKACCISLTPRERKKRFDEAPPLYPQKVIPGSLPEPDCDLTELLNDPDPSKEKLAAGIDAALSKAEAGEDPNISPAFAKDLREMAAGVEKDVDRLKGMTLEELEAENVRLGGHDDRHKVREEIHLRAVPDTVVSGDDLVLVKRYRCRDCNEVTRLEDDGANPGMIRCPSCNGKAHPLN